RRHTRFSRDWSSDVCSSDLNAVAEPVPPRCAANADGDSPVRRALPDFRWERVEPMRYKEEDGAPFRDVTRQVLFQMPEQQSELRSEERRVGKEGGCRWAAGG